MDRCTLDIDNRESKVLVHAAELSGIQYEKKQLTVGDYILRKDSDILAAIERKSLDDAGASIKDGRMANTAKLVKLRAKTGCRIIYIIECPKKIPNDDKEKFSGIPFGSIRSMIYHLILRENITVMWTIGTIGTARELVKLVQSAETLLQKIGDSSFLRQDVLPVEGAAEESGDGEQFDLSELTKRYERSDHEIVRDMWNCFKGISVESADDYIGRWSLYEIVTRAIPRATVESMQMSNRRKINKIAVNSLFSIGPIMETRLLSCVPGISVKSADDILRGRDLRSVLTAPIDIIATYKTGKRNTCLGRGRAERIIGLFTYKMGGNTERPEDEGYVLGGEAEPEKPKRKPRSAASKAAASKAAASKATPAKPAAKRSAANMRAIKPLDIIDCDSEQSEATSDLSLHPDSPSHTCPPRPIARPAKPVEQRVARTAFSGKCTDTVHDGADDTTDADEADEPIATPVAAKSIIKAQPRLKPVSMQLVKIATPVIVIKEDPQEEPVDDVPDEEPEEATPKPPRPVLPQSMSKQARILAASKKAQSMRRACPK